LAWPDDIRIPEFPKEPYLAHRVAILLLALSALAALAAFCFGSALGPWLAAFAGATFPVALIALGAAREGRLAGIRWALGLVWIVLAGGLFAIMALPQGGPDIGGLPLGTALMLFVLVPVPLLLLGFLYAASFDGGLREEDLDRIRRFREEEA
jgi:hypothetical protein